jgi:predicted transcriptional regulator
MQVDMAKVAQEVEEEDEPKKSEEISTKLEEISKELTDIKEVVSQQL